MSKKQRVNVRVKHDEAVVVASVEFWNHLRSLFMVFSDDADTPEEAKSWVDASDLIGGWVERTYMDRSDNDDE